MTKRITLDITLSDMQAEYLEKIAAIDEISPEAWLQREIPRHIASVTEFHASCSGLEVPDPATIGREIEESSS